ncbi:hypothetical protein M405DRAFT_171917 [Rhizopogon salebrosus TDB-379]|nr:hypothetical protein M405DRAFT_171917 [Rhizopogon salebrosus TDB-379]
MPQAETDALCKNVSATRTRSFLPRTCTRQVSRRNLLDGAWESFARTRFSWWMVKVALGMSHVRNST